MKQQRLSKKISLAAGVAASTAFLSGGVVAAPITVTNDINVGSTFLSASGTSSFAGQFDIASLLPNNGEFNQPYEVTSAKVMAYGFSQASTASAFSNAGSYSSTSTTPTYRRVYYSYSYRCGWRTCYSGGSYTAFAGYRNNTYTLNRGHTSITDSVADTMQLDLGTDQSLSDTVGVSENSYRVTRNTSTSYGGYYSYNSGTTRTYNTESRYIQSGGLSIESILNPTALTDLSLDGLLDFNLMATLGQFRVDGLRLVATINTNPQLQSVPEPGGVALMLLGLFFGGAMHLKRKRGSAAA